jgi:iron complex outermembrane receptor protein
MKLNRIRQIASICALTGMAHPNAYAQDDLEELALAYGDKATISIATGSKQSLRRAPAIASVVTAEDIAAMGATDLDEVLETVPGVHVSHSANNYSPLFVIRGIYAQLNPQTLILQNGIPLTTLQQGNRGSFWGGYPIENIARIEVIRGPGSALYGADAYSGVINIITKSAADMDGGHVGVRAGSFGTHAEWAQWGGKVGDLDVAASVRMSGTDGFKSTIQSDNQSRSDIAAHTAFSHAPGSVNTGKDLSDVDLELGYGDWHLRTGYKLRDDIGTAAGIGYSLDPYGKSKSERTTIDLSWSNPQVSANWGAGATASYAEYIQNTTTPYQLAPPSTTFPTGQLAAPSTWERNVRLSAYATYAGFQGHSVRVGIGHDDLNMYRVEEWRNFTYGPTTRVAYGPFYGTAAFLSPHERTVSYLYAQDEWSLASDWTLTAGLRRDNFSDTGGTTNPRLALVWDADYNVVAKLLYGTAFRAPSFAEQYSINNPVNRGNPAVRPETIKTTEAAVSWQATKDLQLNVNVFQYLMSDIIRTVSGAVANTGQQDGKGVEMEAVWDISPTMRLTGNYSQQSSIDKSTNQDAGYAPHRHLYVRGDWQLATGPLLSIQADNVADRRRATGIVGVSDTRPALPNYTTVDITLRTSRGFGPWEFAASVRNLFNADVREPSLYTTSVGGITGFIRDDLPMAPRSVYLQATYRL